LNLGIDVGREGAIGARAATDERESRRRRHGHYTEREQTCHGLSPDAGASSRVYLHHGAHTHPAQTCRADILVDPPVAVIRARRTSSRIRNEAEFDRAGVQVKPEQIRPTMRKRTPTTAARMLRYMLRRYSPPTS
jgi:hypothetical protein